MLWLPLNKLVTIDTVVRCTPLVGLAPVLEFVHVLDCASLSLCGRQMVLYALWIASLLKANDFPKYEYMFWFASLLKANDLYRG